MSARPGRGKNGARALVYDALVELAYNLIDSRNVSRDDSRVPSCDGIFPVSVLAFSSNDFNREARPRFPICDGIAPVRALL